MADFEYLYADLTNRTPSTPGGQSATFNWVAGQTVKYAVKFRQTSAAGTQEDVLPTILNLRAAVGREGASPESGWYKLKVGSQPISETNSTERLDCNADAAEVEQALNEILDGPKDFECDQVGRALLVRRRGGEDFKMSAVPDGLRPASYSKVTGGQKIKKAKSKIDIGPIRYTASNEKDGENGNAISIEYVKPPEIGAFSVEVQGERVIVNLKTKAVLSEGVIVGYDVETKHPEIVSAINASASASVLLSAAISPQFVNSTNDYVVAPVARAYLSGGVNGSGYEYSIEFSQAPIVFSDWAGSELPPKPTIQKIQAGGRTPGYPPVVWPTIQAIYVPPDFEGSYQLYRALKLKRSDVLVKDDGTTKIKSVLDGLMKDEGGVLKVTNPSNNIAHLEFLGDLNGYDVENLEVVVYSSPPPVVSFTLNLDNPEVNEMLRDRESVTLPFELDATVWVDSKDPTKGTKTIKIWKTVATIKRSLLWDSMAARPPINWQSEPNPIDYVPFSRSQFITGQQASYVAVIGNAAQKTFAITHNLGQANGSDGQGIVAVVVRENKEGGRQLRDDEYEIHFTNSSTFVLDFPESPAENSLAVIVVGYGSESAFAVHTHPIDQVKTVSPDGSVGETLRGILDDFNSRIARLERLIPRAGGLPSGMQKKKVIVPVIGEILPDIFLEGESENITISSQIVASQAPKADKKQPPEPIAGTSADEQKRALEAEIQKLKAEAEAAQKSAQEAAEKAAEEFKQKADQEQASKPSENITAILLSGFYIRSESKDISFSPIRSFNEGGDGAMQVSNIYPAMRGARYPMLLPAIHAATAQDMSSVPAGFSVGLYRNSGAAAISLPGGNGRKVQTVAPGGFFAGDGRAFYTVRRNAATSSYHPIEMERDLARVLIQPSQFPDKTKLSFSWSVDFGFDSDSLTAGAGYSMIVRSMPVPDVSVPSPTGVNVGAVGADVVLGVARISLSRKAIEKRKFSIAMVKDGERSFEFSDYGVKSIGNNFPAGAFLLTIRLEQWDVDDSTAAPTGQVAVLMPDTMISVDQI